MIYEKCVFRPSGNITINLQMTVNIKRGLCVVLLLSKKNCIFINVAVIHIFIHMLAVVGDLHVFGEPVSLGRTRGPLSFKIPTPVGLPGPIDHIYIKNGRLGPQIILSRHLTGLYTCYSM